MNQADICILGAAHANDNGVPLVQAVIPLTNENDDGEQFGECDLIQSLGVTSLPFPKDKDGHAEGVLLRGCGNRDGVLIGARDTRTTKIVGKLGPGDTVLHSTGPEQAAQVQCKEKKRQVVASTKDSRGKGMMVVLDGKNDKVQITGLGYMFEMSNGAGIVLMDKTGKAGIQIKDGVVSVFGDVVLGGRTPDPAFKFMLGPATGSLGGATSAPMLAAPGVSLGR